MTTETSVDHSLSASPLNPSMLEAQGLWTPPHGFFDREGPPSWVYAPASNPVHLVTNKIPGETGGSSTPISEVRAARLRRLLSRILLPTHDLTAVRRESSGNAPTHSPHAEVYPDPLGLASSHIHSQRLANGPTFVRDLPTANANEPSAGQTSLWLLYVEQAREFDERMTKGWNESLDVLLIFAALFSGILTAFLVASYSSLQGDNTQTAANALTIISAQLAALSSSEGTLPAFQSTPFTVSIWSLCFYSLWFLSLTLSLTAALSVMVVKQWIYAYSQGLSSVPQERGRKRHFRYEGLRKWRLPEIINALPILVLLSVLLFLLGLVLFLYTVHILLCVLVIGVVGMSVAAYAVLIAAPIIFIECPYRSPLSDAIWHILRTLAAVAIILRPSLRRVESKAHPTRPASISEKVRGICRCRPSLRSLEERETQVVSYDTDLDTHAFVWLMLTSTEEDVREAALLGLVGWDPPAVDARDLQSTVKNGAESTMYRRLGDMPRESVEAIRCHLRPRLPTMAGLCSVTRQGTWVFQSDDIAALLLIGVDDSESQSARLLACVILLHVQHLLKESEAQQALKALIAERARFLVHGSELPIFGTRLFLDYMRHHMKSTVEDPDVRAMLIRFAYNMVYRHNCEPPSAVWEVCYKFYMKMKDP